MFVIVGLGNPGKEYANTRHNIGYDVVSELAEKQGILMNKLKFNAIYGEGRIGNEKVMLVKPTTFMNNSGIAVREIMNFYKLDIKDLIVVVDDIDIDFLSIKIKKKGSAGTHNGLKSIIYHLHDDNFIRVKIGIGKKREGEDLADFVLSTFPKVDRTSVDQSISKAAESVESIIKSGVDFAMNMYNLKQ